jgi:hypothetical protein
MRQPAHEQARAGFQEVLSNERVKKFRAPESVGRGSVMPAKDKKLSEFSKIHGQAQIQKHVVIQRKRMNGKNRIQRSWTLPRRLLP